MKGLEKILWYGLLGIALFTLGFSIFSLLKPFSVVEETRVMGQRMSRMTLTEFDMAKGREFMDKDNDGECDVCGMPVEMCLDSGQLQCNMGGDATIGILGSQHIHADWKVYVNGVPFDWSPYADLHERQMKGDFSITGTSAFIHIHPSESPEKSGDVLHMHATGIPLWLFFESIGVKLPEDITLYVNGEIEKEGLNYVFNDLDKLLLTNSDDESDIKLQLNSITDFSKSH